VDNCDFNMSRGHLLIVLAALLLVGTEASRILQQTPDLTIQCLETTNNAVVKQGTTGRCPQGGGLKVCGQYGRWSPTRGSCTDQDLSIQRGADGRPTFISGPQPSDTPALTKDLTMQCLDMNTNEVVKQGSRRRCAEAGGSKLCGRYGRWQVTSGSCSETDLALRMRNEGNTRVIDAYITGGQPV
jgi:uncharacterized protein (DUF983 family)